MPSPSPLAGAHPQPDLRTLPNGVRALAWPLPGRATVAVSVYVQAGSAHEPRHASGLTHVVEHMLFKGTATRDARRINADAEQLGAEANAHTDKDHFALHLRGLAEHVESFVAQLADLLIAPTFPPGEIEAERQVLLHEMTEVEDDPMAIAFQLFDRASWGLRAAARPVIGERALLERFTREQLVALVRERFTAPNVVVVAAGALDPEAFHRSVARHFGALPSGPVNTLPVADWRGGVKTRDLAGHAQTHLVLGLPAARLGEDTPLPALAAACLGEGMGSPLMDELREKRGLLYYAACSHDTLLCGGQFVVEASTAPEQAAEAAGEVRRLLQRLAAHVPAEDLQRAQAQLAVRRVRALEEPGRLVEDSALELLATGRLRAHHERLADLRRVDAQDLQAYFAALLRHPMAVAATGRVRRGLPAQLRQVLEVPLIP